MSRQVLRPRLLDRIEQPDMAPITLITAPAGYGKSTLVSQWAEAASGRVAWISLGSESNNPLRFRAQVEEAVRDAVPDTEPMRGGECGAVDVLARALETLAQSGQRATAVFDDYHQIDNPDVHEIMGGLIGCWPEQVNLILISREIPPLALGRMHAEGLVRHLTEVDLSFTLTETGSVAEQVSPRRLTASQIANLGARTEGWIAGIRLALTSLERVTDPAAVQSLIDTMPASRWLDDYIVEEVLAALPEDVRDFVLKTVILPELTPSLCNAVLGIGASARLLDEVSQRLVFVRAVEMTGKTLTYHALFAESVGRIADRRWPDSDRRERHRRAAHWYEGQGRLESAVEHAVAAEDWGLAVRCARTLCLALSGSDRDVSLLHWLGKLPERQVLDNPELAHWYIFALHYTYQPGAARRAFSMVEPMWQASGDPVQLGYLASTRSAFATWNGDFELALRLAGEALDLFSPAFALDRLDNWSRTIQLASYLGKPDLAEHAFRQAEDSLERLPGDQWWYLSHVELMRGNSHALRGNLQLAYDTLQQALERFQGLSRGQKAKFRFRLAAIALEWNDLDAAAGHIRAIERDFEPFPGQSWRTEQLLNVARILEAIHQPEQLETVLRRARFLADQHGSKQSLILFEAWQAQSWLRSGSLDMAKEWAGRVDLTDQPWVRNPGDVDPRLVVAQVEIASNQLPQAATRLTQLIDQARQTQRWAEIVSLCMWHAVAREAQGDDDGALTSLRTALRHGMTGGLVRSFLTPGYDLAPFLNRVEHHLSTDEVAYLHRVQVVEAHPEAVTGPLPVPVPTLPGESRLHTPAYPLSARELEVLALVHQGCTNREISERLYITERTVKKHMANTLRKLKVPNRTAAVIRGLELGMFAL